MSFVGCFAVTYRFNMSWRFIPLLNLANGERIARFASNSWRQMKVRPTNPPLFASDIACVPTIVNPTKTNGIHFHPISHPAVALAESQSRDSKDETILTPKQIQRRKSCFESSRSYSGTPCRSKSEFQPSDDVPNINT